MRNEKIYVVFGLIFLIVIMNPTFILGFRIAEGIVLLIFLKTLLWLELFINEGDSK